MIETLQFRQKLLRDLIFNHKNDYGFQLSDILDLKIPHISNLSVIIPYFEAGSTLLITLHYLYSAIFETQNHYPEWIFEVIILDDGSKKYPAESIVNPIAWKNLNIITSKTNMGRTFTRNEGLLKAKNEKCLFMDCDIFVDQTLLLNSLKLDWMISKANNTECIVVSFFENTLNEKYLKIEKLLSSDIVLNDFRIGCDYEESWIGCDSDKKFISRKFHLINETNYFKNWKGMIGPWCLTNMILGGFFIVDRKLSLGVNGFDYRFNKYGFTETSLPTKLMAAHNCFLIPQLVGGAIHFIGNPAHLSQNKRNKYFQNAHKLYFNKYLSLSLKDAESIPLLGWNH
jgi:glycosyltransferase involved in cell wall biosynthesis